METQTTSRRYLIHPPDDEYATGPVIDAETVNKLLRGEDDGVPEVLPEGMVQNEPAGGFKTNPGEGSKCTLEEGSERTPNENAVKSSHKNYKEKPDFKQKNHKVAQNAVD